VTQEKATQARIAHPGESIHLVGYLCYPSDIRVTQESEGLPVPHWRIHEFMLCSEEHAGQCPVRRGRQGEGIGGCYKVEVKIDVGYAAD